MLRTALDRDIEQLVRLERAAETERQEAPKSLARLFSVPFSKSETNSEAKIAPTRAEAESYNAELKTKGCGKIDIDAALVKARAEAAQTGTGQDEKDLWSQWTGKGTWMSDPR